MSRSGVEVAEPSAALVVPRPREPEGAAAPQVPASGYAQELLDRARLSALWIGVTALIAVPAWSVFDVILEPGHATAFIRLRFVGEIPVLACLWLLWRHPVGRRHPELLSFLVLAVVQAEIAWMVVRASHAREFYVLGFSLALYASGCLVVGAVRWTVAGVVVTWLSLGAAAMTAPDALSGKDLAATCFYLSTASVIGLLAHAQRSRLSARELVARERLEHEQVRNSELLARLERQSNEDALTGLANRRRWDDELEQACAAAQRDGSDVALVLIDVDRFKAINDRHGHAGGDEALRRVGAALTERVAQRGLVARLGGDELGVLLPDMGAAEAVVLAESFRRDALAHTRADGKNLRLSLSLGVAAGAGATATAADLMAQADLELYSAKRTRNTVSGPGTLPAEGERRHGGRT